MKQLSCSSSSSMNQGKGKGGRVGPTGQVAAFKTSGGTRFIGEKSVKAEANHGSLQIIMLESA